MTDRTPQTLPPDAIVAVLMILIGAVLLFDRLDLQPLHAVVQFWPLPLMGGGMAILLNRYDNAPPRR